jgi:hypothetical protein
MNSNDFAKLTSRRANLIVNYINNQAPGMVIRKTLRFIDGNFRAHGWQGQTFQPWKEIRRKGAILVKTGALRRGMNYSNLSKGTVRFYNNMPYSGAHNRGFKGTVNVRAHTRSVYTKAKVTAVNEFTRSGKHRQRTVTTKTGERQVAAHTRKMNVTKRQFAPYEGNESPVLNNSIVRELEREIKRILTL